MGIENLAQVHQSTRIAGRETAVRNINQSKPYNLRNQEADCQADCPYDCSNDCTPNDCSNECTDCRLGR